MRLNGKVYIMPDLRDFNVIADYQKWGVDLNIASKFQKMLVTQPLEAFRQLLAYVAGIPLEEAGIEIQKYLKRGGNGQKLLAIITDEINANAKRINPNIKIEKQRKKGIKFFHK